MFKLCDLRDASQSVWLVAPKVTIGRGAACDLTIADDSVAKLHAEVVVDDKVLILHNLADSGALSVNGAPVERSYKLVCGDEVQIGSRTLAVVDPKLTRLKSAGSGTVSWALRANHPAIAGKVFPVRESSVVGRSEECDITFSLSHLSRRHARLEVREGLLFVIDLGSANGTFVNNRRVNESRVRRGDELRFDTLSFSIVGPADDLDKTSVRPAVSMPPVRAGIQPPSPESVAGVMSFQPGAMAEPREQLPSGELRSSAWIWIGGALLIAAGTAGYFWASAQGLL